MCLEERLLEAGVSVVIPCYNSAETLDELVGRLVETLPQCHSSFEILLVNDASADSTWQVIDKLAKRHPSVIGIDLGRNFGQHNATLCGIRHARYNVCVTMDDDLQQPPEEMPKLLALLDEELDLVYGVSTSGTHALHRRALSWSIRLAVRLLTRQPTVRDLSPFRAFRTSLRASFSEFNSPHSLVDVLLGWGTHRVGTVAVTHQPRQSGRSNYGWRKLFSAALLLWTGYSTAPLRFASLLGFAFVLFGIATLGYVLAIWYMQGSLPGFPFLASTIAVFGGVQLFALGMIGEYIARIFQRSTGYPVYVVRRMTERP